MPGNARSLVLFLVLAFVAGCSKESAPPDQPRLEGISRVELAPASGKLRIGEQVALVATVYDASGSEVEGATVTWSSGDSTIASVSDDGVVEAHRIGEVQVRAAAGDKKAVAIIQVEPWPLGRIEVSPSRLDLLVGDTAQLSVELFDERDVRVEGREPYWSSADPDIAEVDQRGTVTALAPGTTRIRASIDGLQSIVEVSVSLVPTASSIEVTSPVGRYFVGDEVQLEARVFDAEGNPLGDQTIAWSSSVPAVAEIGSDGRLRLLSAGQSTISATVGDVHGTLSISVEHRIDRLIPSETSLDLLVGETRDLTVELLAADGSLLEGRTVAWVSADPSIASIHESGQVVATGGGNTVLRAEAEGKHAEISVSVTRLRFSDVEVGGQFACGITTDQEAWCWGSLPTADGYGAPHHVPRRISERRDLVQVASGAAHICVLTAEGEAWCLGQNLYGELGDGTTVGSDVLVRVGGENTLRRLFAGNSYTCGLTINDEARCWGSNYAGELGTGDNIDSTTPRPVAGGHSFATLATNQEQDDVNSTCGVAIDGTAWCWGDNGAGQLGNGSDISSNQPVAVSSGVSFSSISIAGYYLGQRADPPVWAHACATSATGEAWCWGRNVDGQLGDGTTTNSQVPVRVIGNHSFQSISVSGGDVEGATCGLDSNGQAFCWGSNHFGELGNGTTDGRWEPAPVSSDQRFVQISRGRQTACARTMGNTLWCWGVTTKMQVGQDTGNAFVMVPTLVFGQ